MNRHAQRRAEYPLNNPVKIDDLCVGWQNSAYARIDDDEGYVLLDFYGRTELKAVIEALQTTLQNMERRAEDYQSLIKRGEPSG